MSEMNEKIKEGIFPSLESTEVSTKKIKALEAHIKELEQALKELEQVSVDGSDRLAEAYDRIKELEQRELDLRNAISNAQEENPGEIHCSCVPLLKTRIKELEEGVR